MENEDLSVKNRFHISVEVLTALFVFAAASLFLSYFGGELLADPDTQWHIASGRLMLETMSFPVIDPFSHTFAGQPWIAKEWGGQIALSAAYLLGGWSGVTVFTAVCAAFAYALVAAQAGRFIEPIYVILLVAFCVIAGNPGIVARPHIVTLPLFAVFTIGLLGAIEGRNNFNPPWFLVPVMVIWANSHGLFTLGFAMAAFVGLHVLVNCPANQRLRMVGLWLGFGLALVAAACITPYGWRPILMTLTIANGEPMAFIQEWEPLAFEGSGLVAYVLLAIGLLVCLKNPKANLGRILIIGFFGYLMARHMRFILQFSVVMGILAAAPLSMFLPRRLSADTIGKGSGIALLAGTVMSAIFAIAQPNNPPPSSVYPLEALKAAQSAGLSGPVFNSYDFGGFLALEGVPTFVDGRTDQLFIGGFRMRLEAALTAKSSNALAEFMKPYAPKWALITPKGDEQRQLEALGWTEVFQNQSALVLRAP
jgi:hypothetical protein